MADSSSNVSNTHWVQPANESSDAQELTPSVFERDDPVSIARSLKHSADKSARRRTGPYRSAMSMLTFYINRAGKQLPVQRREVLEQAKDELRILYGKPRKGGTAG
ncbi:hypothetical protein A6R71_17445 [Xanthomonas translucens pv. arrhenatheri]|uniref:DUF3175 domain-containing protein n=2 Tax=Xanthomonas graminis TaxID=3390026 RepID=A0A0K2ZLB7_9XANT|nr:DUF3175 domain-containing protein [Xanthomonas translucens]OAX66784.1 hypothetical protein A6R71_17445 [Xanthomonas translucens pv. arrhenatheri]UKE63552.1 DUF3175 domain-containing protein [Xanthomonas translucens pv. poae]UKE76265.1 DUF3175 domain-containing protein [Xanthomonas translucens pv. arrhenatheri]CTP85346.1 hypothetical protein XTPLMG728_0851 [Xanthomonas translucens pv. poae]CTP85757.1 hypothetical protein XTALMG727_1434 [Xanthomonas translucens pv. arrhenatheri LMG 727]